jgi:hypothetical protein
MIELKDKPCTVRFLPASSSPPTYQKLDVTPRVDVIVGIPVFGFAVLKRRGGHPA